MKYLALSFALLWAAGAGAIEVGNPLQPLSRFKCEELLKGSPQDEPGPIDFYTSGRNETTENALRRDAKIITQIAHELGLATPPHQINFMPDEQLSVMASLGGQPTPTWMDGHSISTSMGRVLGIMEFVTPGCPTCRSYYSDKTELIHQRAVLMHVMGHNDMANTARVILDRKTDPPAFGASLALKIAEAYEKYDHDEVSLFVQQLDSIQYLQDFTFGAVELPEKFTVDNSRNKATDKPAWNRTANALQALVHQLGPTAPEWKHEILALFEGINRVYPAYANSKVMNEGWASMMEYLIARHAPESWRTSNDIVEYATMMAGVAYPSLTNPYWLGLMGWWNVYEKFKREEVVKNLTPKEQDRAFIAWAREKYANMTDFEWIQMTIDQEFTDRWRLFIYRKTQRDEFKQGIPAEKQSLIALSRNAVRIRQYLIRKIVDRSRQIPRIELENPAARDPSKLSFHQALQHDLPLEPISAVKTLFVISQIFEKRASLNFYISPLWVPQLMDLKAMIYKYYEDLYREDFGDEEWVEDVLEEYHKWIHSLTDEALLRTANQLGLLGSALTTLHKAQIEIAPNGELQAWWTTPSGQREPLPNLQAKGEEAIATLKADTLTSLEKEMSDQQRKRWQMNTTQLADHVTDPAMGIVQYAPFAGEALRELISLIETRFPRVFKQALHGGRITPSRNGVRLQVLPERPQFSYDVQYMNMTAGSKPVGYVDGGPKDPGGKAAWDVDDKDSRVAAGEYLPGDLFPAPPPGEGKGKGKGKGDPTDEESDDEGEAEDNEGNEPNPGSGGNGGSDLEIPLALYGKLLAEELELPNLRRTGGESEETRTVHRGKVHKPQGQLLWHEIAIEAMHIANAVRKSKGEPYGTGVNPYELIREGMRYIDQTHYIVRGKTEKPRPDFDAVLVVNIDLTGSMMGERIKMAKNLVYNLKALLSANYKNVRIHYVGFDSAAEEVPESKIWTYWKGGGTAYAPALIEDQKILARYPTSRWNKFVLTIGDGETNDGAEYVRELGKMSKELQYAGLAITTNGNFTGFADLMAHVEGFKSQWPWIGTTVMTDASQMMRAIKDLFPKGGEVKK